MQPQAGAQENRTAELTPPVRPCAPWRAAYVEVLSDFRLRVRFSDGTAGVVDMGPFLRSETAGVFAPLRDETLFRKANIVLGAITWPGDLDLAPDGMHRAITEHGMWVVE